MNAYRFLWIFLCVLGISIGQILFKLAAGSYQTGQPLWRLIWNPYLISAGFVYVAATVMWVWQLRFVPINQAYPVFALAFVVVPLLGWFLLGEKVHLYYVLGVVLIMAGVVLATFKY